MKKASRATRLCFLAFGMSGASWAPMIPILKDRLVLDDAQFGLILFASGLGGVFVMLLSGWLVKLFGSALVTVISGALMISLFPLLTIAPTLFYLGVTLFLLSGAGSAMNIALNVQAVTVESQSQQSLMSGFHCLFSTGNWLAVLIVGLLLGLNLSLFYCGVLISALIALIIFSQWKNFLPDEIPTTPAEAPRGVIERRVYFLGLVCSIAFMSEGCMANWSAIFLSSSLHYSTAYAGIGYALFAIAMTVGRLLGDRVILRFGQSITFQMSCLLEMSGFIILAAARWPYAELVGFLLVGLGASNIVPILFSTAGKFRQTAPSYALAIITTFGHAGNLMGSVLVGFVAKAFSLALAFGCIAAVLLVIGLFGYPLALKSSKA